MDIERLETEGRKLGDGSARHGACSPGYCASIPFIGALWLGSLHN